MKNDKPKVGSLSLYMQKFEISPKKDELVSEIESEEIKIPIRKENRIEKFKQKMNNSQQDNLPLQTVSKNNNIQIAQTTFADKSSNQLSEEEQLLKMCENLISKVDELKQQKYNFAVQQYAQERTKKMQYLFGKQQQKVSVKCKQKQKELELQLKTQKVKISKQIQQIQKYRAAYQQILIDLSEKKGKIGEEYETSLFSLKDQKQKLIGEWKRACNDEVKKFVMRQVK